METGEGKYIYCIIPSSKEESFGPLGIGGRGDEVYTVCCNDLAAVISSSPLGRYDMLRDHLLAHEKAIEEVMKTYTVLPVRFSTIAENEEKIKRILFREHDRFCSLIAGLHDKKELGIKVLLKEAEVFKDIAEKHDGIKRLKEIIADRPLEASYYERVKIGEMVETALEKEKDFYSGTVLKTLSPLAVEVKTSKPYGDKMILNAAFLVNKNIEEEFDGRVRELDDLYGGKIILRYVGTLPPFNFVNLEIRTDGC